MKRLNISNVQGLSKSKMVEWMKRNKKIIILVNGRQVAGTQKSHEFAGVQKPVGRNSSACQDIKRNIRM